MLLKRSDLVPAFLFTVEMNVVILLEKLYSGKRVPAGNCLID
ncbi:hypothetical protein HMPREF0061_1745 [Aerococcus viridans ATCC 11563 = CCUG 4311]|uniref:Uncharacterized protein n=1 Tax=Aerococcus viridans (strain ATCC 11563 / DSM 20340 / CCUG 4311 / JCM 20461 / NBRC 12219 / NCTC 8251 / M1) TaxID=655812 RepID=A0ABN0A6R4_AERVM|nr:hypothetical protein HMPREF0061_1745 [Aerococcus viridans ATCC 11563 = CCUG 4311]